MVAPRTPLNVPTLTEVIAPESLPPSLAFEAPAPGAKPPGRRALDTVPAHEPSAPEGAGPVPPELAPPDTRSAPMAALDEAELVEDVLAQVQRQIDAMLEYRLRGVLAPVLARAGDQLISQMREELVVTLRDVVSTAVAQELARHRGH